MNGWEEMQEICEICHKPSKKVWNGVGQDHKDCQRSEWKRRNLDIVSRGVRMAVKLGFTMEEVIAAHDEAMASGYGIPIEQWYKLNDGE